jgi:hypothetical protein
VTTWCQVAKLSHSSHLKLQSLLNLRLHSVFDFYALPHLTMATLRTPLRPLACFKSSLRHCRQQSRSIVMTGAEKRRMEKRKEERMKMREEEPLSFPPPKGYMSTLCKTAFLGSPSFLPYYMRIRASKAKQAKFDKMRTSPPPPPQNKSQNNK